MKRQATVLAFFLAVGSVSAAYAAPLTIDTTGSQNSSILFFGEPDTATYGQTFTLATDMNLLDFMFRFDDQQGGSADLTSFQAYVMAWDGTKATGPVLFSSGVMTSAGSAGFEDFTINTGSLLLSAGQYVAFFNVSNQFDGVPDAAAWASVSGASVYDGGLFVFNNNGNNFGLLTSTAWTQNWQCAGCDLSFKLNAVDAVPEPATLALLGTGLFTMAARRRRKI